MKKFLSIMLAFAMMLTVAACAQPAPAPEAPAEAPAESENVPMQYMTADEAVAVLGADGYTFFDVRKAADYEASHITGAVGVDMDAAKEGDAEAGKAAMTAATAGLSDTLVLVCYTGNRYAQATTNALSAIGYDMSKVFTLEGGFTNWQEVYPDKIEGADAAPALSGTMKVVATSESYVDLFDKFSAETGVKVELLSMSSGEVLSKLRAEGGAPSADLWFGGGIDAFMGAKADGLLEQVNFDAAAELAPEFKDAENYWFSKGMTIVGFLVNDSLLTELGITAPTSWQDLLKEEYKGEIVMSNPAVSGTNYAVVNSILQTMGDEAGWQYFEALNDNIAYYGRRGADPLNKVIANEYAVGISYIDRSVDALVAENPISIVYPTDGMPWVPEGVAVFKNADNVEAAKYFVEWLFSSDENLTALAEIDQKDGVKLVKPNMQGVEVGFDTDILMELDLSRFGTEREAILARFEPMMGDKAASE